MVDENTLNSLFGDIGDDEEFRKRYGELIGVGMSAVIYAKDGIAAKVFRDGQPVRQAFQEAFTLAVVGDLNIPAPRVYGVEIFCNKTVLLMDHAKGVSLLDMMMEDPKKRLTCLDKVVELQAVMHKVASTDFRPLKMTQQGMIHASPGLNSEEKERLIAMLSTLPEEYILCHGDFHGGNILYDGDSCTIIDWAEVSCGCPAADACRSYMDYCLAQMDLEEMYLDKYCAATGRTREEILVWLPVVAGAVYGYLSEEAKKIVRPFF